jgi:hypothetical protein
LSALGQCCGRTDLRDRQRSQLVAILDEGAVELFEAVDPQRDVGRPRS